MSSFIDYLKNSVEDAYSNPLSPKPTNPLKAPMSTVLAPVYAAMAAQQLASGPLGIGVNFPNEWGVNKNPVAEKKRNAANKKKAKTNPKPDTKNMNSQQVQAVQQAQSRPSNSASPGQGTGPARGEHLAFERRPRANIQGNDIINSLLKGTQNAMPGMYGMTPEKALQQGLINKNDYDQVIAHSAGVVKPTDEQRTSASRYGQTNQTGINPADIVMSQQPAANRGAQASPTATAQPQRTGPIDAIGNEVDNVLQMARYLVDNNLTQGAKTFDDIGPELWEIARQGVAEQNQSTGAGFTPSQSDFSIQRPTQGGITLTPVEIEQITGSTDQMKQGVGTILTRMGINERDPAYDQLVTNGDSIVRAYYLMAGEPGSFNSDLTNFPDFVYDRYLTMHGAGGQSATSDAEIFASQLQALFTQPDSEISQMIEALSEDVGDPGAVLWAYVFEPIFDARPTNPIVRDAVYNELQSAETQYYASGFQGTLVEYLNQTGFDPMKSLR